MRQWTDKGYFNCLLTDYPTGLLMSTPRRQWRWIRRIGHRAKKVYYISASPRVYRFRPLPNHDIKTQHPTPYGISDTTPGREGGISSSPTDHGKRHRSQRRVSPSKGNLLIFGEGDWTGPTLPNGAEHPSIRDGQKYPDSVSAMSHRRPGVLRFPAKLRTAEHSRDLLNYAQLPPLQQTLADGKKLTPLKKYSTKKYGLQDKLKKTRG